MKLFQRTFGYAWLSGLGGLGADGSFGGDDERVSRIEEHHCIALLMRCIGDTAGLRPIEVEDAHHDLWM